MVFNLFGLPWTRMPRISPGLRTLATQGVTAAPRPFSPAFGPPQPTGVADTYAVQATLDSSDYATDTTTAPGFDLLQVTGLALSQDAFRPALPVAALTLTLPADASVLGVSVAPAQSVVISGVNIPMFVPGIPLEGADPGGYEEVPSDAGIYPTSPYTYYITSLGDYQRLDLYVMPAVYDPATDQATLYQSVALSVTYQAPVPVVLWDVYPAQAEQPPDQPVVLQGTVMNVGSAPITVTPHISLTGLTGPDFGPQAGALLSVGSGEGAWLTASYSPTGELPDGDYLAHLTLWKGPDVWAETGVEVDVAGGRITRLRGPEVAWPGGTAVFTVTFENHRSEPLSAVPWLTVRDLDGGIIASLSGVTQTVPAGGTTTFTLTWPAVPNVQERLTARAVVAEVLTDAIGETYGPATWHIDTPRWIYLPLVMRDF
jgi:hypothetical protein